MIEAREFVEAASRHGFEWYAGVPCSFLTPFINYVIDEPSLHYVSSPNEGDAVASAAGAAIGGSRAIAMMQNSGLGNAVSPLTSLAYVFRIPMIIICTHRGEPGVKDEPQHALMGRITEQLFDTMAIPWETFPSQSADVAAALDRATRFMDTERRPYAFIMRKGTVAPHALTSTERYESVRGSAQIHADFVEPPHRWITRAAALEKIVERTSAAADVVIATTGFTGRELYAIADRDNHLYMVGSMGCASALGLGLSLARPDLHVTVIDGDGAGLMRMGNFATLGRYGGANLTHILLDNEAHDSTGAQATVSGSVDFAAVAAACGYAAVARGDTSSAIDAFYDRSTVEGARFLHMKIATGTIESLPRPAISPEQVLIRLQQTIGV